MKSLVFVFCLPPKMMIMRVSLERDGPSRAVDVVLVVVVVVRMEVSFVRTMRGRDLGKCLFHLIFVSTPTPLLPSLIFLSGCLLPDDLHRFTYTQTKHIHTHTLRLSVHVCALATQLCVLIEVVLKGSLKLPH